METLPVKKYWNPDTFNSLYESSLTFKLSLWIFTHLQTLFMDLHSPSTTLYGSSLTFKLSLWIFAHLQTHSMDLRSPSNSLYGSLLTFKIPLILQCCHSVGFYPNCLDYINKCLDCSSLENCLKFHAYQTMCSLFQSHSLWY